MSRFKAILIVLIAGFCTRALAGWVCDGESEGTNGPAGGSVAGTLAEVLALGADANSQSVSNLGTIGIGSDNGSGTIRPSAGSFSLWDAGGHEAVCIGDGDRRLLNSNGTVIATFIDKMRGDGSGWTNLTGFTESAAKWIGASDGSFDSALNWMDGRIPTNGDVAIVDEAYCTWPANAPSSGTCHARVLILRGGMSATVSGGTVKGAVELYGSANVTGGTVEGDVRIYGPGDSSTASLILCTVKGNVYGYGDYSTIEGAAISGSVHLIGALGWLRGHDNGGGPDTDTTIGGNLYLGPAFSAYTPSTHVVIRGYILTAWNSQILYPNGDVFAELSVGQVCAEHWTRDGTPPVADGTYTVGKGAATDGTITIEDGIITAVQEATN